MPSGQVLTTGGDDFVGFPGEKHGYTWALKGIRLYNPASNTPGAANWDNGSWETLPAELRKQRWYPSQVKGARSQCCCVGDCEQMVALPACLDHVLTSAYHASRSSRLGFVSIARARVSCMLCALILPCSCEIA